MKAPANEWAGKGVQVNGIAPGYMNTDSTEPWAGRLGASGAEALLHSERQHGQSRVAGESLRNDPLRSKAILERIPAGRRGGSGWKGQAQGRQRRRFGCTIVGGREAKEKIVAEMAIPDEML